MTMTSVKLGKHIKKFAEKGKLARKKLDDAKKLTAVLNFNTIGCQIGEDSLKLRMDMARKKKKVMGELKRKRIKF